MQRPKPKFAVQTKVQDFSSKIHHIIGSVKCEKHQARTEEPCWWVPAGSSSNFYAGVCNARVKKMYSGKISEFAARTNKHPKKERHS